MIPRRKALQRSGQLTRTAFKKRPTRRRKALLALTQGALDLYFKNHGREDHGGTVVAPCQICGGGMARREADPCHKWRRHHGRHGAHEILAAHRPCHQWMDRKEHSEREKKAQADPASCEAGGVVEWGGLDASLRRWLSTKIDPLRGGEEDVEVP